MKNFTKLVFCAICLSFLSCSSNSSSDQIIEPVFEYFIEHSSTPAQFDKITYKITSNSNEGMSNISYVEWNFGSENNDHNTANQIAYIYNDFGQKNVTAKIHGVNGKTYSAAINFTIKEQEYFTVKIKRIEVTGVGSAIWNQFSYNSVGGNTLISLNARFTIRELINNAMQITYQSNFNDANDVTYYNTFHNISWDLNTPYEAKVYKEGNHHPNGGTGNFELNFYGQKTVTNEPIERLAFGHISFNEYRYLKPSEIIYTIGQTNYAITFKLILEWSN